VNHRITIPRKWLEGDAPYQGYVRPVPEEIAEKGQAFLISRLGVSFVRDHVTFVPERSRQYSSIFSFKTGWCELYYQLTIPGAPFVDQELRVVLDERGDYEFDGGGIPYCTRWPTECEFPIDEGEALAIAQSLGAPVATGRLKAEFGWDHNNGYVWFITNAERRNKEPRSFQRLVIDANTGIRVEGPVYTCYRYYPEWDKSFYTECGPEKGD
jgi:hypothetical protein